jgi:hypothetical protein
MAEKTGYWFIESKQELLDPRLRDMIRYQDLKRIII